MAIMLDRRSIVTFIYAQEIRYYMCSICSARTNSANWDHNNAFLGGKKERKKKQRNLVRYQESQIGYVHMNRLTAKNCHLGRFDF